MIELGTYNELVIQRTTSVGLFLADPSGEEVLLPSRFVPQSAQPGEKIRVFCYLDHEERPVATTQEPAITRDSYAALNVAEVNQFGAFMDWGLDKHLLVPFREQPKPMQEGERHVVYCYLDPKSSRLVASARLDRFLDNSKLMVERLQEVGLLVTRKTQLGYEVVVEGRHKGLVFKDQVFRPLEPGDRLTGYVKEIRPDHKLDITLEPYGHRKLEPAAARIYEALVASGGTLPLTDKSPPEAIRERLQMSKKVFKKGVGMLYKDRRIELRPGSIVLSERTADN